VRRSHPVSASSVVAEVAFKPIRFDCRADVWAFGGTEALPPPPTVATHRCDVHRLDRDRRASTRC
jgi:hypothetical protein